MKYTVVVQMKIEYELEAENARDAYDMSQNVELPHGYVEGSWDTQSIIREDGAKFTFDGMNETIGSNGETLYTKQL